MANESDNTPDSPLAQAALALAGQGLRVFPCNPGGKEPMGGLRWKDVATTAPEVIAQWWTMWPNANVAVACGEGSGVTVLDFDVKDGKPGMETAGQLFPGGLPPYARTPSGGVHVWCRYHPEWGNRKLGRHGLDVQGDGAYVVVPPSVVDGRPYVWVDCAGPLAAEPQPAPMAALLSTQLARGAKGGAGLDEDDVPHWQLAELPGDLLARLSPDIQDAVHLGDFTPWKEDGSAALMAVASALWRARLSAGQVLRALVECQYTWQVACAPHRHPGGGQGAVRWLWRYAVIPAKPLTSADVFGTEETLPDPYNVLASADELLDRAVEAGLTPIQEEDLLRRVHKATGVGLRTLKKQLGHKLREAHKAKRHEAKKVELGVLQDYTYVEKLGAFWCWSEPGWVGKDAFQTSKAYDADQMRTVMSHIHQVRDTTFRPFNPWSAEYSAAELLDQVRYVFNEESQRWELNIWTDSSTLLPQRDVTDDDVKVWLRHLDLTLRVRREERGHLLDWLAYTLQHPERKVNHMVVLGGPQGIGKDSLLVPVLRGLGKHSVLEVPGEALINQFDHQKLSHSSLMVLQELSTSADHREARKAYNNLKTYAAAPPAELAINIKGVKQFHIPNIVNVLAVTNDRECMRVEQDDRRAFMVWCEGRAGELEGGYFKGLYRWYREGGVEAVVGWLLERDLSGFDPEGRPPPTEWNELTRDSSLPPVAAAVRDAIGDGRGCCDWELVEASDVLREVSTFGEKMPTLAQVRDSLNRLGYQSKRVNPPMVDGRRGNRRTVYVLRREEYWMDAQGSSLAAYVDTMRQLES